MARSPLPLGAALWAGIAAAAVVLALTLGTLAAVALRADWTGRLDAGDWAALRFTLVQSLLSATLACALAVPVARALARRRFFGRGLLVTLLGAPFILPVIVAVLGLVTVFGRAGWVSQGLALIGLPPLGIYGLQGVVLAHVFFNLPLATRLLLQGWLAIPAERFRLAASLGFSARDVARRLEGVMLREVLPGVFALVFLLCTTSFAVVLALGGGPRATTIELAIYQAFRFDFDLGKAAELATIQVVLSGVAALAVRWASVPGVGTGGLDRRVQRWDAATPVYRALDAALIIAAAAFLLLPLGAVAARGALALLTLPPPVIAAAVRSLAVALGSAGLAVALALAMALAVARMGHRRGGGMLESIGYLSVAASPLVIGTGLFIMIFPLTDPVALALPLTAVVNAVMSLPFALRALIPAARDVERGYGRLADSLALTGRARLRLLTLPRLRRPLGFAAGLAAALSMGDLGVIALYSEPDQATLPLQLYRLMAAYRMDDAAGAALLLLGLSLGLFWLFDRGGRIDVDA